MRVYVVAGGQFGSEAKGHVAAQLARQELARGRRVVAVRVAGHNAGHTAYRNGTAHAVRSVPAMAMVDDRIPLVIAAGSEVDPWVLLNEVDRLEHAGIPIRSRLTIDRQATVIDESHYDTEKHGRMHENLGSTGKGVGAARADRILRRGKLYGDAAVQEPWVANIGQTGDTADWLNVQDYNTTVIIEGTQGYGLGMHAGYYPYCTSSDCRSIDFLAMAGIDPRSRHIEVCATYLVFRTYPIRVAGNSGPLYGETTWEELSLMSGGYIQPEKTTVTQKVRRVGLWDADLARAAVRANGGPNPDVCRPVLTFLDYVDPTMRDVTDWNRMSSVAVNFVRQAEADIDCLFEAVTTGPDSVAWK